MPDEVMSLLPALLREIRDEIRSTRADLSARIDATNAELHTTRTELTERIDGLTERMDRMDRRQTESELRLGTAIADLQLAMNQNTAALRVLVDEMKRQGERIDNVLLGVPGQTMRDVQRRLAILEQKVGIAG